MPRHPRRINYAGHEFALALLYAHSHVLEAAVTLAPGPVKKPRTRVSSREVAAGVLWAAVYNSVWGVAWFAFMQREWLDATAALKHGMPWTEIWLVSVVLTLPLGVATMAYAARRARAALAAALALWLPMTLGMAGWGWHESLSARILVLDSAVNLFAIGAAVLVGAGWHRRLTRA